MAEINIEPRERNLWPWIIVGVVLLALIVWLAMRPTERTTAFEEVPPPAEQVQPAPQLEPGPPAVDPATDPATLPPAEQVPPAPTY